MSVLKFHGEHTRPTDEAALCATCRNAMRVQGTRLGDDITICTSGLKRVTFTVVSCSAYDDERKVPVWELERQAWIRLEHKGKFRFFSPAERARLDD